MRAVEILEKIKENKKPVIFISGHFTKASSVIFLRGIILPPLTICSEAVCLLFLVRNTQWP